MIVIGLGGNLPSQFGSPSGTLLAAVDALGQRAIIVRRLSPLYETAPVPVSDQPWYVNAVAAVETPLRPADLLLTLQRIEAQFGRVRTVRNAARVIDLDILDYDGQLVDEAGLKLPHPRLAERAFVLYPLRDIAPAWRHPVTGKTIDALIAELPKEQQIRRMSGD